MLNKCVLLFNYYVDELRHSPQQWKGINRKQSTRWQHLSRLKASAFFSLQIFFSCYETQQLILWTGTAIWWLTEPHCYHLEWCLQTVLQTICNYSYIVYDLL
jgi:hypothetical protein